MGRAYSVREASIKKTGAAKAKLYSNYAKEIYLIAKRGTPDPESNLPLKRIIDKARKEEVPSDIIKRAIDKAKSVYDKPSIIEVKTILGNGSINAGKNIVHGKPLSPDDLFQLKKKLDVNLNPFMIDEILFNNYRNTFKTRIQSEYLLWSNMMMKETEKDLKK